MTNHIIDILFSVGSATLVRGDNVDIEFDSAAAIKKITIKKPGNNIPLIYEDDAIACIEVFSGGKKLKTWSIDSSFHNIKSVVSYDDVAYFFYWCDSPDKIVNPKSGSGGGLLK
jgi:hypothetical protein